MKMEEEIAQAVQESLEEQDSAELQISKKIDEYYSDPEQRLKTLFYLASLELLKLKGRAIDKSDPMIVLATCSAHIHTLVESIFKKDLQIDIIQRVLFGIQYKEDFENNT